MKCEVVRDAAFIRRYNVLAVLLLLLQLLYGAFAEVHGSSSSILVFVPSESTPRFGSLFRVSFDNSSSLYASAVAAHGVGGRDRGASAHCCRLSRHDSTSSDGYERYRMECSGVDADSAAVKNCSGPAGDNASRTTFLCISSLVSGNGPASRISTISHSYQREIDAPLSLSLHFMLLSGNGSQETLHASVRTQGKCVGPEAGGDEELVACRFAANLQVSPDLRLSSRSPVSLSNIGTVEWLGSSLMELMLQDVVEVTLRPALNLLGPRVEASASSKSKPYLRGVLDRTAEKDVVPNAAGRRELGIVTLLSTNANATDVSLGRTEQVGEQECAPGRCLQDNASIFSRSMRTSPAVLLGRRSLQASYRLTRRGHVGSGSHFLCADGVLRFRCGWWGNLVFGVIITMSGLAMLTILCAHGTKEAATPTEFLESVPSLPPRFSYTKLQRATKNFSRKLGDGAFGSVYEGTLPNGVRVAVKMLEKTSVQGEKQFRAEVASMGAIRHLNLVRLHGFCSEGSHRLLVYEYMANGSLDSWLFGKKHGEKLLDWEQRLNIALGTARALAYLHEECSDHIIHLDVKPENILLDHQYCPKLSDFGLAKLMDREQSRVVTSMRGTPGYLAPEWLLPHAAVTAKTDVYSFGMVLLELVSGRENTNFSLGKEQWYFPAWAFKLMGEGRVMELLDRRLHVEEVEYFHKKEAVRAIHVALLCIQDDPAVRPPMSRVVHMLQGHVEPEPLNARQAAIQPPRRLLTAFAASISDIDMNDARNDTRHDMRDNAQMPAVGRAVGHRVPVSEPPVPKVTESPRVAIRPPMPQTLEELEAQQTGAADERVEPLPAAIHIPSQARVNKLPRMAGNLSGNQNQKCIPPWPVKGDIILLRWPQGDLHGVVRDVRVQTKQMRLALLHRLSSESRWSVREEEQLWRHWNESVKQLDFWVVVRWSTIPGRGFEKFPVEWMVRGERV